MNDPRLITDEELAALREWREDASKSSWPMSQALDAILARNPAPWEPSEDDITAYCLAHGWDPEDVGARNLARIRLIDVRKRGFDAVPRRIEGES